jgi:hypothetical protein
MRLLRGPLMLAEAVAAPATAAEAPDANSPLLLRCRWSFALVVADTVTLLGMPKACSSASWQCLTQRWIARSTLIRLVIMLSFG